MTRGKLFPNKLDQQLNSEFVPQGTLHLSKKYRKIQKYIQIYIFLCKKFLTSVLINLVLTSKGLTTWNLKNFRKVCGMSTFTVGV